MWTIFTRKGPAMAGITITPDGVSFPVPGTDAVVTYNTATRVLYVNGLKAEDRVVQRTLSDRGCCEQAVFVEFN